MPTLTERLDTDYKTALKAGQRAKVDTIRMIKAAIQKAAMDKRKDSLTDQEILPLLSQQVKQRNETLAAAEKGGRQDMIDQTKAELAILSEYLPTQLTPDVIKTFIEEAIKEVGPNQGLIMKSVMAKAAGAADGKVVSRLVGERLKQPA